MLLIPFGLVHGIHYANPLQAGDRLVAPAPAPTAGALPTTQAEPKRVIARIRVSRPGKTRETPPLAKTTAAGSGAVAPPTATQEPRVTRFVGLPDSLAKQYPELPRQLRRTFASLHDFSFLLLPLLILAVTPLGLLATQRRKAIRVLTLGLLAGEVLIAVWLVAYGPERLAQVPLSVLLGLMFAAALATLVLWRSAAGLGGAIAGLLVFSLPAALGAAELDPAALGLDLKQLPHATERVLVLCWPAAVLLVIGREWAVGVSHTTMHDALTQIFNKAYADSIVKGTAGTDMGNCYSVAIFDLDHFKLVNDSHGHGAGDDVLQEVAKVIAATIQNRGLVCRTGGEEMTAFFPGVEKERAKIVCEEVREAVEELAVKTYDNDGNAVQLQVTLSIGLASNLDQEGTVLHERIQDVVTAADKALYSAKESGRNVVILD